MIPNLPPGPFDWSDDAVWDNTDKMIADMDMHAEAESRYATGRCLILGESLARPPEEVRKALEVLMSTNKADVEFMDRPALGAMLARCELVAGYVCEQLKKARE